MVFNPQTPFQELPNIPPEEELFNDISILKLVNKANSSLHELKGAAHVLPNRFMLMSPFSIRESVASNSIENIHTTVADALKADALYKESTVKGANKETLNYRDALMAGYRRLTENGFLNTNDFIHIQSILEPQKQGIRNVPGVAIRNSVTKAVIYTPPEGPELLRSKLKNLEDYFNSKNGFDDVDPLIRAAILHYQFEAIHPFLDGNGRTGRIILVLYLIAVGGLDLPVLFLSKYLLDHREDYYRLLLKVSAENDWKEWVTFMLKAIDEQAKETRQRIMQIKRLMEEYRHIEERRGSAIMTAKMMNYLFANPYYTVKTMTETLGVHRNTARHYFDELQRLEIVKKFKDGRENVYYNQKFLDILNS